MKRGLPRWNCFERRRAAGNGFGDLFVSFGQLNMRLLCAYVRSALGRLPLFLRAALEILDV
jgi:hypothetical protein